MPTILIGYFFSCIADCVATVLSMRALGWFVVRYKPSWAGELAGKGGRATD